MKVSFWKMAKEFGIMRILLSWDLIFSFFVTLAIVILVYKKWLVIECETFSFLISISATLFGLLFGAFAIVISLSDAKFIKILRDKKIFNNLMFPYWYISILYLLSIIAGCVTVIFNKQVDDQKILYHFFGVLTIFLTLYSLLGTFYRIAATFKFGVYRALLIDHILKEDNPPTP